MLLLVLGFNFEYFPWFYVLRRRRLSAQHAVTAGTAVAAASLVVAVFIVASTASYATSVLCVVNASAAIGICRNDVPTLSSAV